MKNKRYLYNEMAKIIRIKNARLFKRRLTESEMLAGLPYCYGTQDEQGRLSELGAVGNGGVVVFNGRHIGRGVQIVAANKEFVDLALPLPSTGFDVDVLYDLAKSIARKWSSKTIIDVDIEKAIPLQDVDVLRERDYAANVELLNKADSFKQSVVKLPCVMHPISIDAQTLKSFGTKETYALFAEYLHSRQRISAYYSSAVIGSLPGVEGVSGYYVLIDDGDMILPIKPDAAYKDGDEMRECDHYLVAFGSGSALLKADFDKFINKVPANLIEPFDAGHWHIKPLSRELLESLFNS